MNYTTKQTVITPEYHKALQLLNDIAIEKVSQAIKEIVRANGGFIDLTSEDDNENNIYQHCFMVIIPKLTPSGYLGLDAGDYPNVFYLDLEGLKFVTEYDDMEDSEIFDYESLSLPFLYEVLKHLVEYHD